MRATRESIPLKSSTPTWIPCRLSALAQNADPIETFRSQMGAPSNTSLIRSSARRWRWLAALVSLNLLTVASSCHDQRAHEGSVGSQPANLRGAGSEGAAKVADANAGGMMDVLPDDLLKRLKLLQHEPMTRSQLRTLLGLEHAKWIFIPGTNYFTFTEHAAVNEKVTMVVNYGHAAGKSLDVETGFIVDSIVLAAPGDDEERWVPREVVYPRHKSYR